MLVEPRAPRRLHDVAGLQNRLESLRAPAMDEAEMAAVLAGHQLEDDARLAVLADAEHDAFIGPLHDGLNVLGGRGRAPSNRSGSIRKPSLSSHLR